MTPAEFEAPAAADLLDTVAERMRARNWEVVVVETAQQAHDEVAGRIPDGAEIHAAKSKTLEDIGLHQELMEGERYDFLRKKLYKMDRATQGREIRKLASAPDLELGSVTAVTEAGQMIVVSATGSQMGPYSGAAGKLVLVVGSQKIVPDLDTALRRVRDYALPYESARLMEQFGVESKICRVLVMEQDFRPGTTTVILVREPVGV